MMKTERVLVVSAGIAGALAVLCFLFAIWLPHDMSGAANRFGDTGGLLIGVAAVLVVAAGITVLARWGED